MTEELGKLVRQQFERAAMGPLSAETRRHMTRCLDELERAIESLCPAAMAAGPRGTVIAYGPALGDDQSSRVVVFASPERHMIVRVVAWPDPSTLPLPKMRGVDIWGAVAHAIANDEIDTAMCGLCYRAGPEGLANMDREAARARASGLTPIIVVLASVDEARQRACGSAMLCVLPATLETQMDQYDATVH